MVRGCLVQVFVESVVAHGGIAIIADVDLDAAKQVAEQLTEQTKSNRIHVVGLDITSKSSLTQAIDYLDNQFGKIDALVNNAYPRNKNYGRHFFDVEYDDFVKI